MQTRRAQPAGVLRAEVWAALVDADTTALMAAATASVFAVTCDTNSGTQASRPALPMRPPRVTRARRCL